MVDSETDLPAFSYLAWLAGTETWMDLESCQGLCVCVCVVKRVKVSNFLLNWSLINKLFRDPPPVI